MRKAIFLVVLPALLIGCNNSSKDSVEKADSTNQANLDTGLNNNDIVIDEASSTFLVKVANGGMAETEMASFAQQKATYQPVKDFAGMLFNDHSGVNEQVKTIAGQKKVVLPATISDDKQTEVKDLEKRTGKDIDKEFVRKMIKSHEASITMFENAMLDAKDSDVRSFADKTLPTLKAHLDSAKALQKKYW